MEKAKQESDVLNTMSFSDSMSTNRAAGNQISDQRQMKINFLECENSQLIKEIEDLKTTLKINKNIIKNMMENKNRHTATLEYTFQ